MPDTLTQLIAKVQAQLLDNGTLFTAATVTAAARQALADLNRAIPDNAAVTITAVADQKEYELTDEDAKARKVIDVLLDGALETEKSLDFDQYIEDSRVFLRLRVPQQGGETLIVRYTKPYTVSGLDGETDSTLTDQLNTVLIDGTCYYCCVVRSAYAVEANSVNTNAVAAWNTTAAIWFEIFNNALKDAKKQNTPVGEPDTRTWEDPWHSWT